MTDERLRRLERDGGGGLADRLRLLAERARAGRVDPPVGLRLDGAWLEAPLSAEARLYAALHEPSGTEVAVQLHRALSGELDASAAAALRGLDHPHLMKIEAIGLEAGEAWTRCESLAGARSLAELQPALDPRRAAGLARQAALGAAHLHARGLVHGRISPPEAWVHDEGRGRLVLTPPRPPAPPLAAVAAPVSLLPAHFVHFAPEALSGGEVGPPADVWGVGATLFFLLAGRPAFVPGSRPVRAIRTILAEPAPDLRALRRDAPPRLAALVARCLEKEPGARVASARELAEALVDASL